MEGSGRGRESRIPWRAGARRGLDSLEKGNGGGVDEVARMRT
jgi:hypothetical protein